MSCYLRKLCYPLPGDARQQQAVDVAVTVNLSAVGGQAHSMLPEGWLIPSVKEGGGGVGRTLGIAGRRFFGI